MTTAEQLETTHNALVQLIDEAGGPDRLITPRGWRHMGLVIIDAVFSLQADYDSIVMPMLKRYCDAAPGLSWSTVNDSALPEHDARKLIDFLEPMSLERRYEIFNRQIGPGTAKRGGPGKPKAEIVVEVAQALGNATTYTTFVEEASSNHELKWKVLEVPGVGFACWKYMLNLSGAEVTKPDTMVLRWLERVVGAIPSPSDGAALIEGATKRLQEDGMNVTVRQIDQLVWRKESGRVLTVER